FYSSGISKNQTLFELSQLQPGWEVLTIETLYHGGWMVVVQDVASKTINGHVISNYGTYYGTWGLPQQYTYSKNYGTLKNNTVWSILTTNPANPNVWTLVSTEKLTTFTTGKISIYPCFFSSYLL